MTLKYLIGVDAGGTHTTAIAYNAENKEQIKQAETGPGQINTDYDLGMANITQAINKLLDQIDGDCERILCGISGLSVIGNNAKVAATISAQVDNLPVRAVTDSLLALYAGLEGSDGSLVIAGTGSVFNGLQSGHIISTGGYGSILGDEGSGYAIALSAIKQGLLSWDKREKSPLIPMLDEFFAVDDMSGVTGKFYKMANPDIAALAVKVAELADQGTPEAIAIITEQAKLLARNITIGLDRFDDPKPMKIALTGSVLANNEMMRQKLETTVHEKYPQAEFSISNGENARGVLFDKSKDYRYFTKH